MRQPAAVMARGFWLIELLPALHTEQDPNMADESGCDTGFFFFYDFIFIGYCAAESEKGQMEEEETREQPSVSHRLWTERWCLLFVSV